tara:strand:+ start:386 stop:538 length:153 start_codon:yes stop_codon:yes gene_type:complete
MNINYDEYNVFSVYLNAAIAMMCFVVVLLMLFGLLDLEYFKGVDLTIMGF